MTRRTFAFIILIASVCVSCNETLQYSVRAVNNSGEQIKIEYKSLSGKNANIAETVLLQDGENKIIIWTDEISPATTNAADSDQECERVAEYIEAFIKDSIPSQLNWCDSKIKLNVTDIGQREFVVEYGAKDFTK